MANNKPSRERARDSLKKVVRNGAQGLKDWRRWWLQLSFVLVLLILGISVAFMLSPSTSSTNLPIHDEDVGHVASSDIKAPESFPVVDEQSTERLRREGESSIRSVYDFELELGQERMRRLSEAFGNMQVRVHDHDAEVARLKQDPDGSLEGPVPEGKEKPRKETKRRRKEAKLEKEKREARVAPEIARLEEELAIRLDAARGEFLKNLQVVVTEEDFIILRDDHFSPESLKAVTRLVERTMRHMVVNSRELMDVDRGKGITVRFQHNGVPERELVVSNFSRVLDLEMALEKVEQAALLDLAQVPPPLRAAHVRLAKALVTPNLFFNRQETNRRKLEARDAVQERTITIRKNAIIIRKGDIIDQGHILVFRTMKRALHGRADAGSSAQRAIGAILIVMLMLALLVRFAGTSIRKFRMIPKDLALLALILFTYLVSTKVWFWVFGAVFEQFKIFPLESYYYAIPFAAGAMLIRFVLNSEMALAFTLPAALLGGMLVEDSFAFGAYSMVSSLVAAGAVGNVNQRTSLLKAGAVTGLANIVLVVALAFFKGSFFSTQTISSAFHHQH
ncbi:MAG: hypothetical protein JRF33_09875 [Deltaproteobacteria bacterium]|nr:hypothetical protein [Deltaproteobacteria bacterium]